MKRVFTILFVLLLLAGGAYYAYSTNDQFKGFVHFVLNLDDAQDNTVMVPDTIASVEAEEKKEPRQKIPKVLKRDKYYKLDDYARKTPKQYEKDIKTLAKYLIIPAKNDIQKARVLFTWVATHVEYDDSSYNAGDLSKRDYSAKGVLESKKAVCEGYSNLLKELCDAAGLEAEKISGYAKGYGYDYGEVFTKTNHAWNAIKIDGQWKLFDATWASGAGENINGKMVSTKRFSSYWFDVNPKEFLFSHLPKHPKWQLTSDEILRLEKYEKLPELNDGFFVLGFNTDEVYDAAIKRDMKAFVKGYATKFPLKMVEGPYGKGLKRGEAVQFTIQSDYAEDIAMIEDEKWHYFKKEGNLFKLSHVPSGKDIQLAIKINWYDKTHTTFAEYKVISPDAGVTKK